MGRKVWVPVVSGPLAQYAAEYSSWLASKEYSRWSVADRLYQFDQLSRWLACERLDAGDLTGEQAECFARTRREAGVVSWSSPHSVALPLEFLRQLGTAPAPALACPQGSLEVVLAEYGRYLSVERGLCDHTVFDAYVCPTALVLVRIGRGERAGSWAAGCGRREFVSGSRMYES
jgi:hypothetical protein